MLFRIVIDLLLLAAVIAGVFVVIPYGIYLAATRMPEQVRKSAGDWFSTQKKLTEFRFLQIFYIATAVVLSVLGEVLYLVGFSQYSGLVFFFAAGVVAIFIVNFVMFFIARELIAGKKDAREEE